MPRRWFSCSRRLTGRPSRPRGFTLVECLLAVALLAGVVGAVAQIVTAGQMATHDALNETKATSLAQAMMEEVLAQPYYGPGNTTPTGPGSLTRGSYDCIGNYNGLSEATGAVEDASLTLYSSDYEIFSRSVSCTYNTQTITGLSPSLPGITVAVTVSDGHGRTWSVSQFVPQP